MRHQSLTLNTDQNNFAFQSKSNTEFKRSEFGLKLSSESELIL